jgi:hypothetical protein
MRKTGGECITDTFRYKYHVIPIPGVTATDCILKATHHLTTAIDGVQEAAPDKLQAIKSLHHILLGKRILQQPRPLPPTLLCDSNFNKEQIHMWDPTIHALPILPSNATPRVPQTGRAIIDNDDDAPPHPVPAVHMGSPAIINDDDDASPMVKCPWT